MDSWVTVPAWEYGCICLIAVIAVGVAFGYTAWAIWSDVDSYMNPRKRK